MEDIELKDLWKEYDQKLEEARLFNLQAWAVNLQTFTYLQTHKAKSKLDGLVTFKVRVVIVGVLWVLFLGFLVYGNQFKNPYFAVSLGMIMIFNIIAIVVYVRHIILIRQIDYGKSITDVQQRLTELQASTIQIVRILFLQTPFYCTWCWHKSWIHYDDLNFWLITFPITLFLTLLSVWLFRNISLRNVHKKWFRALFRSREWTAITTAMDYLREIEKFRKR